MQRCVCLRNRNAQTVEKCTVLCVKSSSPTHTCAATCESRYARAIKQENHHYFLVIFESKQPAMDKKIDRAIRNVSMLQTKRHILVLLWSRKDLQTPNGKNRWVQMHAIKPKLVLFTQHMMCFNVERYVFFWISIWMLLLLFSPFFFFSLRFLLHSWNNAFNSFNLMRICVLASLAYLFIVHRSRYGSMLLKWVPFRVVCSYARTLKRNCQKRKKDPTNRLIKPITLEVPRT